MEGRTLQCPFCKRVVKIESNNNGYSWRVEHHSIRLETFAKSLMGPVPATPVMLPCVLSYAPIEGYDTLRS